MAERLKATVLKIVSGVTRSRVRIPVPPPFYILSQSGYRREQNEEVAHWDWCGRSRIHWAGCCLPRSSFVCSNKPAHYSLSFIRPSRSADTAALTTGPHYPVDRIGLTEFQ